MLAHTDMIQGSAEAQQWYRSHKSTIQNDNLKTYRILDFHFIHFIIFQACTRSASWIQQPRWARCVFGLPGTATSNHGKHWLWKVHPVECSLRTWTSIAWLCTIWRAAMGLEQVAEAPCCIRWAGVSRWMFPYAFDIWYGLSMCSPWEWNIFSGKLLRRNWGIGPVLVLKFILMSLLCACDFPFSVFSIFHFEFMTLNECSRCVFLRVLACSWICESSHS